MYPPDGAQQQEQVNRRKHRSCKADGEKRNRESEIRLSLQHAEHQKFRKLGKQNAESQPQQQAAGTGQDSLPRLYPVDMPLFHAQHIIKAKFPGTAAKKEGMGIKQENHRKYPNHPLAQRNNGGGGFTDGCTAGQTCQNVKGHDRAAAGKQVGQVQLAVFTDAGDGQPQEKAVLHRASPPVAKRVSVSEIFWYSCSSLH